MSNVQELIVVGCSLLVVRVNLNLFLELELELVFEFQLPSTNNDQRITKKSFWFQVSCLMNFHN